MRNKSLFFVSLFCLFVVFTEPANAADIRLSAAASLTEAVTELIAGYAQEHPQVAVLPNFASSGALAKQISAGAPADIYISANPKWMQYLQQQGLVAADSMKELLQNRLVVVGSNGTEISSLRQLSGLSLIAICSPKSSPAGQYAEQALSAAGVYASLVAEQKLVLAKDVRQALLYADRGEVDAAFVYRTDALLATRAQILFAVPQDSHTPISYPVALTARGAIQDAPRAFYAYLFSAEGQQVFRKHGFLIPTGQ